MINREAIGRAWIPREQVPVVEGKRNEHRTIALRLHDKHG